MKPLESITAAFQEVYSQKRYFLWSGFFSMLVFSINAAIRNYKLLLSEFSPQLLFNLIINTHNSMSVPSLAFLITISLLSGILFSFSLFLLARQITYSAGVGLSGIITSILTPACSSCALGLAGLLGMGGFLSVLPFKGLELGILGIVLLLLSLVYLSRKISANSCRLPK